MDPQPASNLHTTLSEHPGILLLSLIRRSKRVRQLLMGSWGMNSFIHSFIQ